jgi:hypothetical protein
MVLKFLWRFSSVNFGHVGVPVALVAAITRRFLHPVEKFWSLLLEELAVRVIIFEGDAILLHDVVVGELG